MCVCVREREKRERERGEKGERGEEGEGGRDEKRGGALSAYA